MLGAEDDGEVGHVNDVRGSCGFLFAPLGEEGRLGRAGRGSNWRVTRRGGVPYHARQREGGQRRYAAALFVPAMLVVACGWEARRSEV